jgi:hypothetical protein
LSSQWIGAPGVECIAEVLKINVRAANLGFSVCSMACVFEVVLSKVVLSQLCLAANYLLDTDSGQALADALKVSDLLSKIRDKPIQIQTDIYPLVASR